MSTDMVMGVLDHRGAEGLGLDVEDLRFVLIDPKDGVLGHSHARVRCSCRARVDFEWDASCDVPSSTMHIQFTLQTDRGNGRRTRGGSEASVRPRWEGRHALTSGPGIQSV